MKILNVAYDNLTRSEALDRVFCFEETGKQVHPCFLNADCLRQAQKDPEYARVLNEADLVLSDGVGLRVATRLFGGTMRDNCNGTDLSPLILEQAAKRGHKVFFLGGKSGIAQKAAENIQKILPDLNVVGTHTGYFDDDDTIVSMINDSGADILFVAMGVPRQEKWIARHKDRLSPKLCLGVGAFLDYLSGTIPRAPLWMRRIHLEWAWRIFVDPKRMIKRYCVDGAGFFIWLVGRRIFLRSAGVSNKA